jgi:hypothetical protein
MIENEVTIRRRRLPHWEQREGTYFVTLRTAETLTRDTIARLRHRNRILERFHPKRLNGMSQPPLKLDGRDPSSAQLLTDDVSVGIVRDSFVFLERSGFLNLHGLCVVETHFHCALRTLGDTTLREMSWKFKSFTSKALNRHHSRTGAVWQEEYFDCLICDQKELDERLSYIKKNVDAAGLDPATRLFIRNREFVLPGRGPA